MLPLCQVMFPGSLLPLQKWADKALKGQQGLGHRPKPSAGASILYLKSIEEFSVRCGEYNVKSESSVYQTQESGVAKIYYNPQYQPIRPIINNLAILRTRENFIYQEHVGPVCLPRS